MDRERLTKRYRYLWTGEAASSILFTYVLLFFALRDGDWTRWILRSYSTAAVVFILVQGLFWWRAKLRLLKAGGREMPARTVARYRRLRTFNWLVVAAFPLAVLGKRLLIGRLSLDWDFWLGLAILAFAVLEQINYYYVQLMYDSRYDLDYLRTRRGLRPGTVAKVLARQEE